jgi:hypothetical protein
VAPKAKKGGVAQRGRPEGLTQRGDMQCIRHRERAERKETRGERGGTPRERRSPNDAEKTEAVCVGNATHRRKLPLSSRCWAVDTKTGNNNKGESTGGSTSREEEVVQTARYSHVAPLLGGKHKKTDRTRERTEGGQHPTGGYDPNGEIYSRIAPLLGGRHKKRTELRELYTPQGPSTPMGGYSPTKRRENGHASKST